MSEWAFWQRIHRRIFAQSSRNTLHGAEIYAFADGLLLFTARTMSLKQAKTVQLVPTDMKRPCAVGTSWQIFEEMQITWKMARVRSGKVYNFYALLHGQCPNFIRFGRFVKMFVLKYL